MPRTEEQKKAWGAKMKLAREAKKQTKERQIVEGVKPNEEEPVQLGRNVPPNGNGSHTQPNVQEVAREDVLPFDWEEAPLEEARQRAADLKREYERVSAIVIRRQNPNNRFKWKCWTQENMSEVPPGLKYNGQSVRSSCLRGGDGITQLPKFTDNGNFEIVEGVRTLKPVHCCNFLCYQLYQSKRVRQKVEAGV